MLTTPPTYYTIKKICSVPPLQNKIFKCDEVLKSVTFHSEYNYSTFFHVYIHTFTYVAINVFRKSFLVDEYYW